MTDRLQQKAEQWVRERWGHPETTPLMLKQVFRSEIESYVAGITAGIAMAADTFEDEYANHEGSLTGVVNGLKAIRALAKGETQHG